MKEAKSLNMCWRLPSVHQTLSGSAQQWEMDEKSLTSKYVRSKRARVHKLTKEIHAPSLMGSPLLDLRKECK